MSIQTTNSIFQMYIFLFMLVTLVIFFLLTKLYLNKVKSNYFYQAPNKIQIFIRKLENTSHVFCYHLSYQFILINQ